MVKTIEIDGKLVTFKASAALPRIYRVRFHRDLFKDLEKLAENVSTNSEGESTLDLSSLETFEDIAFLMAKYADDSIPDTAEEWLDGFEIFSIYEVLPEILSLWKLNLQTDIESKKNLNRVVGK